MASPTISPSRMTRRTGLSTGARLVFLDDAEDLFHRAARRFGQRPAGQPFRDRVEERDPAFAVGREDGVSDAPQSRSQPLFAVSQRLLRPDPGEQVAPHDGDERSEENEGREAARNRRRHDAAGGGGGLPGTLGQKPGFLAPHRRQG